MLNDFPSFCFLPFLAVFLALIVIILGQMGRLVVKRYSCPFPIKCSTCHHTENITSGLSFCFGAMDKSTLKPVAIDCEMVGVGPKAINALGRISVIDYDGDVLYDVMVRPDEEITDFRTRWSGIRPIDMRRSIPFACAQEQVERIIQDRIVIGHMVHNDFSVLNLKHPPHLIRDTAKAPYAKVAAGFPAHQIVSLRTLTLRLFGIRIQNGEHCSTEDARATMAIYRLTEKVWETDLKRKDNSENRSRKFTDLHSSSVCDLTEIAASPSARSLKRSSTGTESLLSDSNEFIISKRPCQDRPLLHKSSSSSSLLDDHFWPDE